mmetsp:Transcript_36848/g.59695  ORF Transcript_36848/g.59695 Transcript_36848/m.59695 type:complete len:194 (+) Transcript_36848:2629-3210(+)
MRSHSLQMLPRCYRPQKQQSLQNRLSPWHFLNHRQIRLCRPHPNFVSLLCCAWKSAGCWGVNGWPCVLCFNLNAPVGHSQNRGGRHAAALCVGSPPARVRGCAARHDAATPSDGECGRARHGRRRRRVDAWMAIRGKVYNVTPFARYHPGGVAELARAAGDDGSTLFEAIHPWVSEGMLDKCGKFWDYIHCCS